MKDENKQWSSTAVRFVMSLLVVAILSMSGVVSVAQEAPDEHPGFLAAKGRVTYRTYCANCHGQDGTGNGNLAQYLSVKPADVTQMREENDGEFPQEKVQQIIDGRKPVRGHGGAEMPIWGDVFQSTLAQDSASTGETGEERAQRKINELVLYLESIQVD